MAYFRDINLGLARSLHGYLKWHGVYSNGLRVVVKDLTCIRSRPSGLYIKSQNLYLRNSSDANCITSWVMLISDQGR